MLYNSSIALQHEGPQSDGHMCAALLPVKRSGTRLEKPKTMSCESFEHWLLTLAWYLDTYEISWPCMVLDSTLRLLWLYTAFRRLELWSTRSFWDLGPSCGGAHGQRIDLAESVPMSNRWLSGFESVLHQRLSNLCDATIASGNSPPSLRLSWWLLVSPACMYLWKGKINEIEKMKRMCLPNRLGKDCLVVNSASFISLDDNATAPGASQ